MYQNYGWKYGLTLFFALGAAFALYWNKINTNQWVPTGLDLSGGSEIIYDLDFEGDTPSVSGTEDVVNVLRERIDTLGVKELSIARLGNYQVVVQIPKATDTEVERIMGQIQRSGRLQFKLIVEPDEALTAEQINNLIEKVVEAKAEQTWRKDDRYDVAQWDTVNEEVQEDSEPRYALLENVVPPNKELFVDGNMLADAYPTQDNLGRPCVGFEWNAEGRNKFYELTSDNVGRRLAVVLDGRIRSAPVIQSAIGKRGIIEGGEDGWDQKELSALIVTLKAGALPAKPIFAYRKHVGAQLGAAALRVGSVAIVGALAIVVIFMLIYYRFRSGLIADIALALNLLLILGTLALFEATLTLPGIAGILLTAGMAVDANILIYERIREEVARGAALKQAIRSGYDRAFWTIFDANLTTALTALVLMKVGTGPIKGFGLTLTVGIVSSMFTSLFVTKALYGLFVAKEIVTEISFRQLFKRPSIDFIGHWGKAITGSLVLIAAGWLVFLGAGTSKYGIDFTGGTALQLRLKTPIEKTEVAKILDEHFDALGKNVTVEVQRVGERELKGLERSNEWLLRTRLVGQPVQDAEDAEDADAEEGEDQTSWIPELPEFSLFSAAYGQDSTEPAKPEEDKPEDPKPEEPKPEEDKPEEPTATAEQPAEEPAAEQPVEQPAAEEPAAEQPAAEEPAAEEPAAEEPAAEQPAAEEPAAEEPAAEEPAAEEPAAEEPAAEEPAAEQPAEEPAAEQPAAEEPAAEEPAAEQPAEEQPAAEEPAAEEPAVEQPAAEEPAAEEPAAEEPAAEEPAAEEPAAEQPAEEPVQPEDGGEDPPVLEGEGEGDTAPVQSEQPAEQPAGEGDTAPVASEQPAEGGEQPAGEGDTAPVASEQPADEGQGDTAVVDSEKQADPEPAPVSDPAPTPAPVAQDLDFSGAEEVAPSALADPSLEQEVAESGQDFFEVQVREAFRDHLVTPYPEIRPGVAYLRLITLEGSKLRFRVNLVNVAERLGLGEDTELNVDALRETFPAVLTDFAKSFTDRIDISKKLAVERFAGSAEGGPGFTVTEVEDSEQGEGVHTFEFTIPGDFTVSWPSQTSESEMRSREISHVESVKLFRAALEKTNDNDAAFYTTALPFPNIDQIGSAVAKNLKSKAIIATLFSAVFICLYVWLRFDFWSGIAAIVAVAHDVLALTGFLAITDTILTAMGVNFDVKFSLTTISAFLTTVGYSINDTIVILDRIREDKRLLKAKDYTPELVNGAINKTLSRTCLTSLTSLLVCAVLLVGSFFGLGAIQGFAVAMTFGVLVGTYSSLFVAAPLLLVDKRKVTYGFAAIGLFLMATGIASYWVV